MYRDRIRFLEAWRNCGVAIHHRCPGTSRNLSLCKSFWRQLKSVSRWRRTRGLPPVSMNSSLFPLCGEFRFFAWLHPRPARFAACLSCGPRCCLLFFCTVFYLFDQRNGVHRLMTKSSTEAKICSIAFECLVSLRARHFKHVWLCLNIAQCSYEMHG